jgi:PGF-pre-PGF domain-containing protein
MMKHLYLLLLVLVSSPIYANTYLTKNSAWDSSLVGSRWTYIASGDIDNDGYKDIVQVGCTGGTPCNSYVSNVYINNRTSFVLSSWGNSFTKVNYGSIALGDVDNDGDLDLAYSGCTDGGNSHGGCNSWFSSIYVNNGSTFIESIQWKGNIVNAWKTSLAFGDINLDGKIDLIFTGVGNEYFSKVYINNGTSFNENSVWEQYLTGIWGGSATLVDVDNDGDLDLFLVGDSIGSYVAKAYINNGITFVENSTWEQNLLGVELASTTWGDFDNNGRMDFSLTGHTSSDEHRIYNNTCNSLNEINNQLTGSLLGIYEGTQSFGDYNNDGKLDLFASGEERYSTLYTSPYASYSEDPEPDVFGTNFRPSAVWSDVDNDGALDLVLIGSNADLAELDKAVYINNITTKNTPPQPPTTLNANYSNGILNLSWNMGSDAETPALGLYYNLRVGSTSGGNQIVTGVYGGGDDNGYFGNMMQRRNILLNLPNLTGTIYWSVQTIDTGLKVGAWATERVFIITSGNQTNQSAPDTTAPNVTITSPANGATLTSSEFTVFAAYSDNSSATCSARLDSGSYNAMNLSSGTATYSFSAANGQHTVYVNCTDAYNNNALRNVTFTVSITTTSNPPGNTGGGGSGGGGSGGTGVTNATKNNTINVIQTNNTITEIPAMAPGEVHIVEVANPIISRISIEAAKSVKNVEIVVEKIEKPNIIAPPEKVYSYLEINHTFADSDIKTASLRFSVEKAWIVANNINQSTISLNRYHDGWQKLDTDMVGENSTALVFEAITPGFSIFAVTGEENVTLPEPDNSSYYAPAGTMVIIIAVVGGFFYYRKAKRKPVTVSAPAQ